VVPSKVEIATKLWTEGHPVIQKALRLAKVFR